MEMVLLSYRKGISKEKQNPYWAIQVAVPCTPADNAKGRFGNNIDMHFIDEKVFNKLTPDMINKKVDFKTSGFGFRASIDEVYVVKE